MELATGDFLIIQDADLEYDPQDYVPMMQALLDGRGDIVYGSRYLGRGRHTNQSLTAYLGGRSLSYVALACTGTYLTDTVTALKLFPREMLMSLTLTTSGFELDHEITAKVCARGLRIVEVPVRYYPRSREEGKKIGMKDWFIGCRTFFRFRNGCTTRLQVHLSYLPPTGDGVRVTSRLATTHDVSRRTFGSREDHFDAIDTDFLIRKHPLEFVWMRVELRETLA